MKVLKNMKVGNLFGYMGLHLRYLKKEGEAKVNWFRSLFNVCLNDEIVREDWSIFYTALTYKTKETEVTESLVSLAFWKRVK